MKFKMDYLQNPEDNDLSLLLNQKETSDPLLMLGTPTVKIYFDQQLLLKQLGFDTEKHNLSLVSMDKIRDNNGEHEQNIVFEVQILDSMDLLK